MQRAKKSTSLWGKPGNTLQLLLPTAQVLGLASENEPRCPTAACATMEQENRLHQYASPSIFPYFFLPLVIKFSLECLTKAR